MDVADAPSHAPRSIDAALDPRKNGLNLLRLCMASGVIVYHSFRLAGAPIPWRPVEQALENLWVDGFFVLSGFLITGSWLRRPHVRPYLRNRLLRIYPGFLVCLIVTAFVLAPIGVALSGERLAPADQGRYVLTNAALYIRQYDIGGTPGAVPWPHAWNGSLWTLFWEFLCYLGILVAGLLGVLRRSWGTPVIFIAAWLLQLAVLLTDVGERRIPLILHAVGSLSVEHLARFALAFAAGMLVYHLRRRLPCSWGVVALCALTLAGAMWLPEYRLLGAIPLAYGLVAAGALMRSARMVIKTDISYGVYIYAFPVQQILAAAEVHHLGLPLYAGAAFLITCLLAYASWVCIERPALALKAG